MADPTPSDSLERKLRQEIRRVHGNRLKGTPLSHCIRDLVRAVALTLAEAGKLTEELWTTRVPSDVFSAAVEYEWVTSGTERALARSWIRQSITDWRAEGLGPTEPAKLTGEELASPPLQATTVSSPDGDGERPSEPRARPGPKTDIETARKVREIVKQVANGEPWKNKIDDVCEALDGEKIPRPKTWAKKGMRDWCGASATGCELVKKAISHHLKVARLSDQIPEEA